MFRRKADHAPVNVPRRCARTALVTAGVVSAAALLLPFQVWITLGQVFLDPRINRFAAGANHIAYNLPPQMCGVAFICALPVTMASLVMGNRSRGDWAMAGVSFVATAGYVVAVPTYL